MSFRFCANLSFMFSESTNFLERYKLAKEAGFKAVESAFPVGVTLEEVVEARIGANVRQILLNNYVEEGQFGAAAIPGKEEVFRESIDKTMLYAKALQCPKIHITAGKLTSAAIEANHTTYESNLRYAARRLETEHIIGLIEPINPHSLPGYYLTDYDLAVNLINKINSPNLKLQLDIFHLQHLCGDLTHNIKRLLPYTGHVQVAQVPDRGEPDTPGEINYEYIFQLLKDEGYEDWIGLEYKPAEESTAGLSWIQDFGFKL